MLVWIIIAVVIVVALVIFVQSEGFRRGEERRAIVGSHRDRGERTEALSGRARAHADALRAPLSGRECVWWCVTMKRWRNDITTAELEDARDLELELEDGRIALVLAREMGFDAPSDPIVSLEEEPFATLMRRAGWDPADLPRTTFHERIVAVGERVEVLAARAKDEGEPYRTARRQDLVVAAPGVVRSLRDRGATVRPERR